MSLSGKRHLHLKRRRDRTCGRPTRPSSFKYLKYKEQHGQPGSPADERLVPGHLALGEAVNGEHQPPIEELDAEQQGPKQFELSSWTGPLLSGHLDVRHFQ